MGYKQQPAWIVGIDEAGRGPLAGPVAVGLVKIPVGFDWETLRDVGDSKQVSAKNRQAIFEQAKILKQAGKLDFRVIEKSNKAIDAVGISSVIKAAISEGLELLRVTPQNCFIKLDGSLKAPSAFAQQTIIKGDQTELEIGLASILAKETRDATMLRVAKKYPQYTFENHKGYGTKEHRRLIYTFGISDIHRQSYCKNRHTWGKV